MSQVFCRILAVAALSGLLACAPGQKTSTSPSASPWPPVASALPADPQLEARIDALLARMTLEQKVGQVIQPEIRNLTPEDVRRYHIGSYLNGGGAFPQNNKHASLQDWVALADSFYHASMDERDGGIAIPIMWGTDAVHGHNNVIGATIFPHNIGLGAARNPELIRAIAAATAREVATTGIDWNFAPTLAVARDDRWGRTYESYSEDPALVKAYGGVFVDGLQGQANTDEFMAADKVIATAKHFIGDGATESGVDRGDARMSEEELFAIHGAGYITALAAGAQTVMASFNSWQGEKLHGHTYLLTEVLKNRMGFDGLVVGDWNGHEFVPGCTRVDCAQAFNAGVDVFMAPDADWKQLYANLVDQVRRGDISEVRLDDAVRRVLRVKFRAGLFEKGAPSTRALAGQSRWLGAPEHRAIAAQAVRESLVLLKNNGGILPLSPGQRVLVAGDGADDIGKQSGGWTISWQGTGNTNGDFPGGTSIYQGIAHQVSAAGGEVELSVTGDYTQKPDVAIVVFGENPYAEMQGDISHLAFEQPENLALLQRLKADGIPVVSLFITGRPLWVNRELNASDAFVVLWLPGSEGTAVADLLFTTVDGKIQHDFRGTLSYSWPASPDQSPLNLGQADYRPLFAYGYGLTYRSGAQHLDPLPDVWEGAPAAQQRVIFKDRVQEPWQTVILDHLNRHAVMSGSHASLDGIAVRAQDRFVQEDALRIQWQGPHRASAGFYAQTRTSLQSLAEADGALVFDVRLNQPLTTDLELGVFCGQDCGAEIALSSLLADKAPGEWHGLSVSLQCLAKAGANLDMLLSPFYLSSSGPADISLYHLRVEKVAAPTLVCE